MMKNDMQRILVSPLLALTLVSIAFFAGGCATTQGQQTSERQLTFRTPEQAVQAIADLAGTGDFQKAEAVFGPGSAELLQSGDEVADRNSALMAKQKIQEKVAFEDLDAKTRIPVLGNDGWQFPFPLVRVRGGWRFDTQRGREEIINRRIGRDELSTIATLHAIVDAQKEYFDGRHEGRSRAYAARVISTPGKHDGLYWPTREGEKLSPLGPLVAEAVAEGYRKKPENPEPIPYHGYYYRPLAAQGRNAPGGARSYVDAKGVQSKGFAVIAWPAKYGNSGVMSFIVDRQGIVFQKDLGPETSAAAGAIQAYDPDDSWTPTAD